MPTNTLNKTTTPPAAAVVPLNNRGRPCTSIGRRNAAAIGSGLGNGGVVPPGRYERRRDCVNHDPRGNPRFREQWRRCLDHLLVVADIPRTVHTVGSALITFSDSTGKLAWPSQAAIGERCNLSASTVGRALAVLRVLELLEWDHRFHQVDGQPAATSNLYEFRIPEALAATLNIGKRRRRSTGGHQIPAPETLMPAWQRSVESMVGAVILMHTADQYVQAEAALLSDLAGQPVEQLTFAAALLNEQWRERHPVAPSG